MTARHPKGWSDVRAIWVRLLEQRTGTGVAEWNDRVASSGAADERALRQWLAEHGVTGYPQMLLVMERFGYPDHLTADAGQLIDAQYADRPALRPVLDRLLEAAAALPGTEVRARKTFVSLLGPRRAFALVRASTRGRVDLGLRLDGQEPAGRLLPARSLGGDRMRLRIALSGPEDVDAEVLDWLRRAYEANL